MENRGCHGAPLGRKMDAAPFLPVWTACVHLRRVISSKYWGLFNPQSWSTSPDTLHTCRLWIRSETVVNRGAFCCSIYSLCSIYLHCRGRAGRCVWITHIMEPWLDLQCRMFFLHLPPPPRLPSGVARETVTAVNTVDINGWLVYYKTVLNM